MRIGIITYYRVPNFGANLQALSTYQYLIRQGHIPIMIQYMSEMLYEFANTFSGDLDQKRAHIDFIDKYIKNQTPSCYCVEEVNQMIESYHIEALIIGADALVQHHPLMERIHFSPNCHRKFRIDYMPPNQMFPNVFWGVGLSAEIKKAMMSVSCQNSKYYLFPSSVKRQMRRSLSQFQYISARDDWTYKMFESLCISSVSITPDPVFGFNENCNELIPSEQDIRCEFHLPSKYILICLRSQSMDMDQLSSMKEVFARDGIGCVALPMPTGVMFSHPFDEEIKGPLDPLKWYGLIKYSTGYIGNNMHPIVTCLLNAVPCVSLDDWVNTDFWNNVQDDGSSKVEHILKVFGVQSNRYPICNGLFNVTAEQIYEKIMTFPKEAVIRNAQSQKERYCHMMNQILASLGDISNGN